MLLALLGLGPMDLAVIGVILVTIFSWRAVPEDYVSTWFRLYDATESLATHLFGPFPPDESRPSLAVRLLLLNLLILALVGLFAWSRLR
jgi:hypothetical protein